jgi:hypothetical protein
MNPEPEDTAEKARRDREIFLRALPELEPSDFTFTAEEIEDLRKNGVDMREVLRIIEQDLGLQDDT